MHVTNVASALPTQPALEQAHPAREIEPQAGAERQGAPDEALHHPEALAWDGLLTFS